MARRAVFWQLLLLLMSSQLSFTLALGLSSTQQKPPVSVQAAAARPQATLTLTPTGAASRKEQPTQQAEKPQNETFPSWLTLSLLGLGCAGLLAAFGFGLWSRIHPDRYRTRREKAGVRFVSRGYERAWWLLVTVCLAAVTGAIAEALKPPLWAQVALAPLVVVPLVVAELRARSAQDDIRQRLLEQQVAVFGGQGQLLRVGAVRLDQLRVHAARVHVPYIERNQQDKLEVAIKPGQAALLVGHSMSGKTRLVAEVIRQKFPDALLLVAESGKALQEIFNGGLDPAGLVVWLDDLERFLGADGLTVGLLNRLKGAGAIVVATIRVEQRETYRPRNQLRPPEWEVLQGFTEITLQRRLTDHELSQARAKINDPDVLAGVEHYGLAEYLGAGPEALDKFEKGEITNPVGQALVQAAIDWYRTGLTRPISKELLTRSLPTYLANRIDVARTNQASEEGLAWATEKINETVALLSQVFTSSNEPVFEAFDYLVDEVSRSSTAIPDPMWSLAIEQAEATELLGIGLVAYDASKQHTSQTAWRRAAQAGHTSAMFNLGVLLREQGKTSEAEQWFRQAAQAGDSHAITNLGVLLREQGRTSEAEQWYQQAVQAGHTRAMNNLGVLLQAQGKTSEAEQWYQQAAQAGVTEAMYNLGLLLDKQGKTSEAEQWLRLAVQAGITRAMNSLGYLLQAQGKTSEAEQWYRQAVQAGDSGAMFSLGYLLHAQGKTSEAKQWYRQAAQAGVPSAMYNLGVLLDNQGKTGEAEQWYRQAAQAGHTRAITSLGYLLDKQGKTSEAEQWYRQAAQAGDSSAMYDLVLLLDKQGKTGEAEQWYRQWRRVLSKQAP